MSDVLSSEVSNTPEDGRTHGLGLHGMNRKPILVPIPHLQHPLFPDEGYQVVASSKTNQFGLENSILRAFTFCTSTISSLTPSTILPSYMKVTFGLYVLKSFEKYLN